MKKTSTKVPYGVSMLNSLIEEIVSLDYDFNNSVNSLTDKLREVFTTDAVDEMLANPDEQFFVIHGIFYVRLEEGYFAEIARLRNGRILEWSTPFILTDFMLDEELSEGDLEDGVVDIIISNDLSTVN